MDTYLNQLASYLITQAWQIAAVFVVVAIVNACLRHRSAHIRYGLWLIVLAKALMPPMFTVPLAVLPENAEPAIVAMPEITPSINMLESTDSSPISTPQQFAPQADVSPSSASSTWQSIASTLSRTQWLALAWLAGVTLFAIVGVARSLLAQKRFSQRRRPIDNDLRIDVELLSASLGLVRIPNVYLVEGISQPFVWGLVRGSIYLPANFIATTAADHRKSVLLHELAHIARYDALINTLQILAQAMFFFHPLMWIANAMIRREREKCCDETAVAHLGTSPKLYGHAIVETLVREYEHTDAVPSLAIAGPAKNIEDRIKTLMTPNRRFYMRPSRITILTLLVLAAVTAPMAYVLTTRASAESTSPQAAAPRIIATTPIALANDISPDLNSITVTFDQPMMDKSWSWTGGGDTFPKTAGDIHYNAERTICTLPVKLEPAKVYWIGINSPSYKNFQTTSQIPAKPYVMLFATKSASGQPTPIPDDMLQKARDINSDSGHTPNASADTAQSSSIASAAPTSVASLLPTTSSPAALSAATSSSTTATGSITATGSVKGLASDADIAKKNTVHLAVKYFTVPNKDLAVFRDVLSTSGTPINVSPAEQATLLRDAVALDTLLYKTPTAKITAAPRITAFDGQECTLTIGGSSLITTDADHPTQKLTVPANVFSTSITCTSTLAPDRSQATLSYRIELCQNVESKGSDTPSPSPLIHQCEPLVGSAAVPWTQTLILQSPLATKRVTSAHEFRDTISVGSRDYTLNTETVASDTTLFVAITVSDASPADTTPKAPLPTLEDFPVIVGCRLQRTISMTISPGTVGTAAPVTQPITADDLLNIAWTVDPQVRAKAKSLTFGIRPAAKVERIDNDDADCLWLVKNLPVADGKIAVGAKTMNDPAPKLPPLPAGHYSLIVIAHSDDAQSPVATLRVGIIVAPTMKTQIMVEDLQPDNSVRFRSIQQNTNTSNDDIVSQQFMNSDFVKIDKMYDAADRELEFEAKHIGNRYQYFVRLIDPIKPGQPCLMSNDGTMAGLLKPVRTQGDVIEYTMKHWPATGVEVRRVEVYRLPAGAELIWTGSKAIRQRLVDGRIELAHTKTIPVGGNIDTAFRYRLKTTATAPSASSSLTPDSASTPPASTEKPAVAPVAHKRTSDELRQFALIRACDDEMARVLEREADGNPWKDKIDLNDVYRKWVVDDQSSLSSKQNAMLRIEAYLGEHTGDVEYDWRINYLLATIAEDINKNDVADGYLVAAMTLYPTIDYADPSKQSKYQHILNDRARIFRKTTPTQKFDVAEAFAVGRLKTDPKCDYIFLFPWISDYQKANQSARLPAFVAKLRDAYDIRAKNFPAKADMCRRYQQELSQLPIPAASAAAPSTSAAASHSDVPKIIATNPIAFANDVPASLSRITVTFDQPMQNNSWSWTGGGDTYPKTTAKPRYDAKRTVCTLPVKLEPGKVYWIGINSPSHRNFKTTSFVPVKWYVLLFATKGADGQPTPIPDDMLQKARDINADSGSTPAAASTDP